MTLTRSSKNPTLKGHKLVFLCPWPTSSEYISKIKAKYPDLTTFVAQQGWWNSDPYENVSKEEWKDCTIGLTGTAMPEPEDAPKMLYVQLFSAGANHVLHKPLLQQPDVVVCSAAGVHGPQITEWVIGTYLSFEHFLPRFIDQQREEKWIKDPKLVVEDSVGKRVGILGYGSIGRQIARVSQAMGMSVHAYTLHEKATPEARRDRSYTPPGTGDPEGQIPSKWFSGSSKEELHDFLGSGLDMVVIALPLTDLTRGLIGKEEFEVMAKGRGGDGKVFLSNIARGQIVKTDDLVEALNGGVLRGAALDVTDPEPLPEGHALWKAKNTFISPHVSGSTTVYYERVLRILDLNLGLLSEGKELTNMVNKKEGY